MADTDEHPSHSGISADRWPGYPYLTSTQTVHAEVTDEGTAVIPSDEVASLGAHPGDRLQLRLVTSGQPPRALSQRQSLRGALRLSHRISLKAFDEASRRATSDAEPAGWPS